LRNVTGAVARAKLAAMVAGTAAVRAELASRITAPPVNAIAAASESPTETAPESVARGA
jgi:5-methyltetrahydropteroyltriglutamate--homocysteine methyltransferase